MDNLYFGEIIRIRREELNMKQEELCEGVCERSTLSKIERGKNECSKYLAEVFLQRLNLPMDFYYASSSKNSIKQLLTKNQIKEAIRMREYDKLAELLEKGMQFIDDSKLYQQFILRSKATYILRAEGDNSTARNLLFDALKILHPRFDVNNIKEAYTEDIYILNMIANTYAEENDHEKAIHIFESLAEILKNRNDKDPEAIRQLIMVEYNLSRSLGRTDYYKECLIAAEDAIELSIRSGTMTYFGELLMNKGYALCSLHGRKEEGILALKDALMFNRLVGNLENIEIIKEDAKSLFDIKLD